MSSIPIGFITLFYLILQSCQDIYINFKNRDQATQLTQEMKF